VGDTADMKTHVALSLALLLASLHAPILAADGGSLAADHGCLNCHRTDPHAPEPPSLRQLSERLVRKGDGDAALKHALEELRGADRVHGHLFITDDSALAILRWMAQGAK
jgi:cytochrome c551/c552